MILKNTQIAVELALETFKTKYQKALADNNVNASGELSKSTEEVMVVADHFVSGSVRGLDYWKYPNFGRGGATRSGTKKGEVRERIKKWIDNKGLPTWYREKKDGSQGKAMTKDEQAFLITRKIQREGYEGKNYVEPIIEEIQPDVDKLIADALFEDLKLII